MGKSYARKGSVCTSPLLVTSLFLLTLDSGPSLEKLPKMISLFGKILISVALLGSPLALGQGKPNVLFISIDDLNDWLGCLNGHPQALTPNLDGLAKRGVLFTNAHCASPACKPSRAAIFSGLTPHRTEVWSNRSLDLSKTRPNAMLIPHAFAKAGYQTSGGGKLLHNRDASSFQEYFQVHQRWSPLTREETDYTREELPSKGTDDPRHLVTDSQGRERVLPLNRMPSDRAPEKTSGESFDWGPWEVPDSDFGDTQLTDWALTQLSQEKEKPFFLALGYYRPHIPLWAPKRFFKRFEDEPGILPPVLENDLDDLSEIGKQQAIFPDTAGLHSTVVKYDQWEEAVEAYLACVTYVDYEIGRVLKALEQSPYRDNTLIVIWSDHGWHLGEKEHWGKWTGWERSTKVPLMIVPPRNQEKHFASAGLQCEEPVSLLDLYPTLAEWCELPTPEILDGISLLPLIKQPEADTGREVLTSFGEENVSLRSKQWRYLRYSDLSEELYDLAKDPHEWHNLSQDPPHEKILVRFRKRVDEINKVD